jgi:hypothetical protein
LFLFALHFNFCFAYISLLQNINMPTETILILGASFAGIGAAHYALRHVLPSLPKKEGITYTVTLVNPSKISFGGLLVREHASPNN